MKAFARSIVPKPVLEAYWAPYAAERAASRLSVAEVKLIASHCTPDTLALDIGANLGAYTWHLVRLVRAVHAFEPIPSVAFNLRSAFAFGRAGGGQRQGSSGCIVRPPRQHDTAGAASSR